MTYGEAENVQPVWDRSMANAFKLNKMTMQSSYFVKFS